MCGCSPARSSLHVSSRQLLPPAQCISRNKSSPETGSGSPRSPPPSLATGAVNEVIAGAGNRCTLSPFTFSAAAFQNIRLIRPLSSAHNDGLLTFVPCRKPAPLSRMFWSHLRQVHPEAGTGERASYVLAREYVSPVRAQSLTPFLLLPDCLVCCDCHSSLTIKCYLRNGQVSLPVPTYSATYDAVPSSQQPYCKEDFYKRFAKTKCANCEQGEWDHCVPDVAC